MSDFSQLDKQIYYVKIIIWEGCPLRCTYCFVDKENNRGIEIHTLEKFIDLLLYTPGHNKLLHLLWWEPLMYFSQIQHAVVYARNLEKKLGKQLDISFCTSGIGFTQEKLNFIAEHDIYLAWSIDGPAEIHNRNRVMQWGKWSFESVIHHQEKIISTIKKTHLWIAMTVDENTVESMFESYYYLINTLGFNCTVNIAPVDGKLWSKKSQKLWITELVKIYEYIMGEIEKGRYLYLNAFNKEFRFHMISQKNKGRCLWFYTEWFTNGDVLFNPFVNKEEDFSRYVVGNVNDIDFIQKVEKYVGCTFENHSKQCNDCRTSYFQDSQKFLQVVQMNHLLALRDRVTEHYSKKMYLQAKIDAHFQDYINTAKDYMYV